METKRKSQTSLFITDELFQVQSLIIEELGMKKIAFQTKAVNEFIAGDHYIPEELKIVKRTDPNFLPRRYRENVYLDEDQKEALKKIALEQNISTEKHNGTSIVLYQALYNYCKKMVVFLPEEIRKDIKF